MVIAARFMVQNFFQIIVIINITLFESMLDLTQILYGVSEDKLLCVHNKYPIPASLKQSIIIIKW